MTMHECLHPGHPDSCAYPPEVMMTRHEMAARAYFLLNTTEQVDIDTYKILGHSIEQFMVDYEVSWRIMAMVFSNIAQHSLMPAVPTAAQKTATRDTARTVTPVSHYL